MAMEPKTNPPSKSAELLLQIKDLHTSFSVEGQTARAVDGVDFDIHAGEVLGLVGESGCGKSVTALSLLKLIPDPPGCIEKGSAIFKGRDLLSLTYDEMRSIRGREIAMIFQEPMTALNPVFTIGFQMREAIQHHTGVSKQEAIGRSVEMLEKVGISDARARMSAYPHQFSGGMRQRVMIAMALSCHERGSRSSNCWGFAALSHQPPPPRTTNRLPSSNKSRPRAASVRMPNRRCTSANTSSPRQSRTVSSYRYGSRGVQQQGSGTTASASSPSPSPKSRKLNAAGVRLH